MKSRIFLCHIIRKNFMAHFYGWGSIGSRLQSHYKDTVYFLPFSSQEFLVLFDQPQKDEKLSRPWSHPVAFLMKFSYEILNAPSEKIMFLWNFYHLFSSFVLSEVLIAVIMAVSKILDFFLGVISWKRVHFSMGVSFSVGGWGASLLNGGHPPWEGISFDGEVFVKNIWDGGVPSCPLWESLHQELIQLP